MLSMSLTRLAAAAVFLADSASGPPRTWIADIKANRFTLAGREVRLEGEVMDLRSTSPTARRGFYRLTDASDPAGVLVRTEKLPMDGGNFRVVALVAPEQLVEGALLVDEVKRDRTDGRPLLPVVAVVISGLALLVCGELLRRAIREERQYLVAPPLWLLPDAGPYGKALTAPAGAQVPLKYQPELEEADRVQREQLKRRKRGLARAFVSSLALTGSSAVWVIDTGPVSGQVPAFIFIDANDPASRAARRQSLEFSAPDALVVDDSALLAALAAPPVPIPAPVDLRDTLSNRRGAQLAQADSVRRAAPPLRANGTPADSPRSEPLRDPAPVPVQPDPAPVPPASPPETSEAERDPEVERTRAGDAVGASAIRLAAAVNGKQLSTIALLMPEGVGGDPGRRDRFLKLVLEFGPRAVLGPLGPAEVTGDRAQAGFSITLTWRGDFGVDRKKSGRFVGLARRQGTDWQFEGARLLDALP